MKTPGSRCRLAMSGALAVVPVVLLSAGTGNLMAGTPAGKVCETRDSPVRIPAGMVLLHEDGPAKPGRKVYAPSYWIDRHEVTNRQFAAFVKATGHRTQAEREGASAVFVSPVQPVPLDNAAHWWRFVQGADWRHPRGPGDSLVGRDNEPVVHVDRKDAEAYAKWAGGMLPTELQWERAARGEQDQPVEPTSWAFEAGEKPRANVWEGVFPVLDTGEDGFKGIAPVGCFTANVFGVHDMVGNVWEWTAGRDKVGLLKGGSFLCAIHYCANFRPAAFQAQEQDLGASHIGFRLVYNRAVAR